MLNICKKWYDIIIYGSAMDANILEPYKKLYDSNTYYDYGDNKGLISFEQYLIIRMGDDIELYKYMFDNVNYMVNTRKFTCCNSNNHDILYLLLVLIQNNNLYADYLKKLLHTIMVRIKKGGRDCNNDLILHLVRVIEHASQLKTNNMKDIALFGLKLLAYTKNLRDPVRKMRSHYAYNKKNVQIEKYLKFNYSRKSADRFLSPDCFLDSAYLIFFDNYEEYLMLHENIDYKLLVWDYVAMLYGDSCRRNDNHIYNILNIIIGSFGLDAISEDTHNTSVFLVGIFYILHYIFEKYHQTGDNNLLIMQYKEHAILYKKWLEIASSGVDMTIIMNIDPRNTFITLRMVNLVEQLVVSCYGNNSVYIYHYLYYFWCELYLPSTKNDLLRVMKNLDVMAIAYNKILCKHLVRYFFNEKISTYTDSLSNILVLFFGRNLLPHYKDDLIDARYVLKFMLSSFFPQACLPYYKETYKWFIETSQYVKNNFLGNDDTDIIDTTIIDDYEFKKCINLHFKVLEYKNKQMNKQMSLQS